MKGLLKNLQQFFRRKELISALEGLIGAGGVVVVVDSDGKLLNAAARKHAIFKHQHLSYLACPPDFDAQYTTLNAAVEQLLPSSEKKFIIYNGKAIDQPDDRYELLVKRLQEHEINLLRYD